MRIHSSAPTRADLAGGTVDIWPLYLFHPGAQTINVALTLRATCTLAVRTDGRLTLTQHDAGRRFEVDRREALPPGPELALVRAIFDHFDVGGLDVETRTDAPYGAGLAGSSALNVALCAALCRWRGTDPPIEALLTTAMNLEARAIGVPTGVQDYRPPAYGGVSAVELGIDGVRRHAIAVDAAALDARLIVAFTGASRQSGINNWEVFKRHIDGDARVASIFDALVRISAATRGALERHAWQDLAAAVDEEWRLRKQLAPGVTTDRIDRLIAAASAAGAAASKICGAGGGGCLLCLADPDRTSSVRRALSEAGATVLDCHVEPAGLAVTVI
jgi:D-glycero-alpha-D-manno-heptose-7-phosphate kinase